MPMPVALPASMSAEVRVPGRLRWQRRCHGIDGMHMSPRSHERHHYYPDLQREGHPVADYERPGAAPVRGGC